MAIRSRQRLSRFSSKVALVAVWVAGMLLISMSPFALNLLPSSPEWQVEKKARPMTITIYTAPAPFEGRQGQRQMLAIYSWLQLNPRPSVVLLGQDASLSKFAEPLAPFVRVDTEIDFTFLGAHMFHTMVGRARASTSDIAVLIEPDLILFPDFIDVLGYSHLMQDDWLLVAMSRNVPSFPFHQQLPEGPWLIKSNNVVETEEVHAYVSQHGQWTACKGGQLWAWNTGKVPLHAGVMPPFVYGQGQHNEWLLNEALTSGYRFVFDASEAFSLIYPQDIPKTVQVTQTEEVDKYEYQEWGFAVNAHLARHYGSYFFRPANFSNLPVKLFKCGGPKSKKFCFWDHFKHLSYCFPPELLLIAEGQGAGFAGMQAAEDSYITSFRRYVLGKTWKYFPIQPHLLGARRNLPFWKNFVSGFRMSSNRRSTCLQDNFTVGAELDCPVSRVKEPLPLNSHLASPFSLESLLSRVANSDKVVVLAVVGNSYRDMLMSWVCRLKWLKLSNLILSAVDDDIYEFAILQGLPVFKSGPSMNLSFNDCHFGTECFQTVTKVKSRTVLQILQLGYHVLLSDVDVYWFKDPTRELMSFGPGTLVAQTDEYNLTEALNVPRRLNSGFYFAWSNNATIAAFERIVKHAATSHMSEQPSFYDVLCGVGGKYRVGTTLCVEPLTNLTVHFLDREKYPNGAYKTLWENENVAEVCKQQGCVILHNNWISGRKKKLARQIASGLWDYDDRGRMCVKSWHSSGQIHLF
ncbi:hypothetical protein O6H91_20G029100 [Diphasiastrum complanatum]|uniref:Uncharacterized protein n=2 Tax=Diphasiastrum complanatum TaxID=34168 RepID=A0ACC2AQH4_DIPCM|nr:hypothetical protein O6H91_20G029100 [Diphasiastrum complanatum]